MFQNGLDFTIAQQYPLSILIVDDEPINRTLIKKILEKFGFEPDIAENGRHATSIIKEKEYDLVFMDLLMPYLDGIATTKWIKEQVHPDKQPVIVAMTANATPQGKKSCFDAGMDDFLSKPVFLDTLQVLLNKWGVQICKS